MKFSAETDIGMQRHSNQDCYSVVDLSFGGFCAVVCDGMGGHAGGNIASKTAVECICRELNNNFRENITVASIKNVIENAIVHANLDVLDAAGKNDDLQGMGTTVVIAVLYNGNCIVANVGDSRCYFAHNGEIKQLTKDHSLVQEMVDAGYITADEAVHHPRKNIITRALGIADDVEIDFFEISFGCDDKLLLCTDGLSNHVSDEDILSILTDTDIQNCAEKLISLANKNGGSDNITAVVISE